jgi:hypothetical protein
MGTKKDNGKASKRHPLHKHAKRLARKLVKSVRESASPRFVTFAGDAIPDGAALYVRITAGVGLVPYDQEADGTIDKAQSAYCGPFGDAKSANLALTTLPKMAQTMAQTEESFSAADSWRYDLVTTRDKGPVNVIGIQPEDIEAYAAMVGMGAMVGDDASGEDIDAEDSFDGGDFPQSASDALYSDGEDGDEDAALQSRRP